jgi:hypothetical protein
MLCLPVRLEPDACASRGADPTWNNGAILRETWMLALWTRYTEVPTGHGEFDRVARWNYRRTGVVLR